MRQLVRAGLAVVVGLSACAAAAAQPPTYSRWTGSTALAQPQGFTQGSPLTLTWGFMATGTPINDSSSSGFANGANDLPARLDAIYGAGSQAAVWQPLFQGVFDRWASVSGLTYQYTANDDGATITSSSFPSGVAGTRADVRVGGKALDGNSNVLAYNYFPNSSDMVIDTTDSFFAGTGNNSIGLRNVVSHEHGHGLGMPHVQSSTNAFLMEPFVNTGFDGPQHHDVLAAQHMYGDAREKSNSGLGNDAAVRASPLGAVAVGSSVSVGNSARTAAVAATATDFVSIDSSTDTDYFSFTAAGPARLTALLEALGFAYGLTPQSGSGATVFDSRLRGNLRLALFGPDGTTLLLAVDANGLGGSETLTFDLTGAGTYYIRIAGTGNADSIALDTQFYGLTVGLTPVPEPASVLLAAALASAGGWGARRLRGPRTAAAV